MIYLILSMVALIAMLLIGLLIGCMIHLIRVNHELAEEITELMDELDYYESDDETPPYVITK